MSNISPTRLIRGDTRQTLLLVVTDRDTGARADIAGSTLRWTVRPSAESSEVVLYKTTESDPPGIEILDDEVTAELKGVARISFTDADWTDYTHGTRRFAWDVEEVLDGKPDTIAGTPWGAEPLLIVQDVTRAAAP